MSTRKKSNNFVQRTFKQIWRFFDVATKAVVNRLLKSLLLLKRQSRLSSRAGFVLPTVVMVILVVTLLTTAIMIRSFDRSKNASNVRVDQAVLNAARPALDRARAKIDRLFSPDETNLEGNTPPESNIADLLKKGTYQLGDETQIELTGDFGGQQLPNGTPTTLRSAWKFPVDTDNNGKFDTFTLYGIYFQNPKGSETRSRGTIEARALPQDDGQTDNCGSGASPEAGWYSIGGQLKKAFFTYVANVPITDTTALDAKYEKYKGNKGFSALEMQLDQTRIGLDNNAVWYQDDIVLGGIPEFKLNGRVHTNSNLLVGTADDDPAITFLQVSSINSCFYNPENAKIVVGGNVAAADIGETDRTNNKVTVDFFVAKKVFPKTGNAINETNKTTTNEPSEVAGNSDAYTQRLDALVQAAIELHGLEPDGITPTTPTVASVAAMAGTYPQEEVIDKFTEKMEDSAPGSSLNVLKRTLETYFADRIRRVSFAEVASDAAPGEAVKGFTSLGSNLQPPLPWMQMDKTGLTLKSSGSTMQMPASVPVAGNKEEKRIGDRVLVGNNLPRRWLKTDAPTYAEKKEEQPTGFDWDDGGPRKRKAVVEPLDDLGDTSRNGFWETAAAQKLMAGGATPGNSPDAELSGGLRIVTGAGIYIDGNPFGATSGTGTRLSAGRNADARSFLPEPTLSSEVDKTTLPPNYTVVWPDTMPMYLWDRDVYSSGNRRPVGLAPFEQFKGDLQMRGTVVYHYLTGDKPLACISSYYDPTDPFTADNANGISNNGRSYPPPASASKARLALLEKQASMVFPDGRWVNKPLYNALQKPVADLSFSEKAAIDAANCALRILSNPNSATPDVGVPDGAVKEKAFLDGRQIKAIHRISTERDDTPILDSTGSPKITTGLEDLNNPDHLKVAPLGKLNQTVASKIQPLDYNLPVEQRQPSEVRVTEIDLDLLRQAKINGGASGQEYLLPNSGIIYATRDDALPDISCANEKAEIDKAIQTDFNCPNAATDFELDPTRRPNGIRLINGSNLSRETDYRSEEKGLILASDLPVYIKGDFNLHVLSGSKTPIEEFSDVTKSFYEREVKEKNFACRAKSPNCTGVEKGDDWRAARILSDAITILSEDFRDGYRYEGDYDLNNNAGNLAVESYLNKGFWTNSYATTAQWYGTDGLPRTDFADDSDRATKDKVSSSYLMNSVTPIQRRVRFPVYKMETCKKLPVSECGPTDWKFAPGARAGDTSTGVPALPLTDINLYNREHYPRRVAFQRDVYGQLVLDTNGHATPLKPNPSNPASPLPVEYKLVTPIPTAQDNSLWFATTSSKINPSAGVPGYDPNGLLYYAPEEDEVPDQAKTPIVHERQFLLPGTPSFPQEIQEAYPTLDALKVQTSLNGQLATDPSDYAVCTNNQTQNFKDPPGGACNPAALTASRDMRKALLALKAPTPSTPPTPLEKALAVVDFDASNNPVSVVAALPVKQLTMPATAKVNVFDIKLSPSFPATPNRQMRSVELTLDRKNQSNPIFVIRSLEGIGIKFENVKLKLKGVDPNNIFWVSNQGGIKITDTANELMGNFLAGLPSQLKIENGSQITAGRFLGFGNTTISPGDIAPLKTTAQPLLVPVLQLHSPTGTPDNPNGAKLNERWLPKAEETTVNAVLVMGDSPPRPLATGTPAAESNGGLANFPRFLEDWDKEGGNKAATAKISGGLVQFKRSAVATSPFEAITDDSKDIALFFDGTGYPPKLTGFGTRFRYRGGASFQKAAYYTAPKREWGFDVGLLSQTPDLYSRRFAIPEAQSPNEYFREVSRDDAWVKTLMCGKTVSPAGNVTTFALPTDVRPTCPP